MERVYQYFEEKGLPDEIQFLNSVESGYLNYVVDRIKNLGDGVVEFGRRFSYIKPIGLSGYQRKAIHLIAEAYGFMSKTRYVFRDIDPCCGKCPRVPIMIVGKNLKLTNKNKASKRKLFYDRKSNCTGRNKSKNNLRPKIDYDPGEDYD